MILALALVAAIPVTSSSPQAVAIFRAGQEQQDSSQFAQAARDFSRALELDPGFVLARSYLGLATPGAAGLKLAQQAAAQDFRLPEAERLLVEANAAKKNGDEEKDRALWRRIAALAPDDWRAQFMLGRIAAFDHKSNAAIVALKKALALNPRAAVAYNQLGYVYADLRDFDLALAALKQYVELEPQNPNSADSLAEIYLWSGDVQAAEQWFRKAASLGGDHWMAWIGVAQCRFLLGDWRGGRKAVAEAEKAAPRPLEQAQAARYLAWSYMAEGKPKEALRLVEGLEARARAARDDMQFAMAALQRARMLEETGAYREALAQIAVALQRADAADISGDDRNALRRTAVVARLWGEARLGDAAAARKSLDELALQSTQAPSNTGLRSDVHFGEGAVSLARGDPAAAAASFGDCVAYDYFCRYQLYLAQENAHEGAAAAETRERLVKDKRRDQIYLDRDPMYLYVYSKLRK